MPANAPAGSDSSERESCDGCDKNIAAKDGTVLGANIYCGACVAKMGASYMPDDREALHQAICNGAGKTTAADHLGPRERAHIIDAIEAAGFTRAHHDGERVAALEKERDAAWWLLEKHPQEIIGILKAERDALAAKLAEAERMLVHHREDWHKVSVRAEAAEASAKEWERRSHLHNGDRWKETAKLDAANKRAAALAEALREIERMPEGPRAGCLPQYTVQNIARAALAGNAKESTDGR